MSLPDYRRENEPGWDTYDMRCQEVVYRLPRLFEQAFHYRGNKSTDRERL
jgi:hypothetical protein